VSQFSVAVYTYLVRNIGTMQSYLTVATMAATTGPDDPEFFWVESTRDVYVWDPDSTETADGRRVVQLSGTTGRAIRMRIAHPKWTLASEFWIDPTSGDDTNTGITISSPLRTIGELCDRLGGKISKPVTVWFLSKPLPADPLSGLVLVSAPDSAFSTSPVYLTVRGTATTLATGAVTTITAKNAAANTPIVITDTSIASFSAYVGRRIRITSGAGIGKTGIIIKAPSANTAWVSDTINPETGALTSNYTSGSAYVIESVVSFTGEEGLPMAALLTGSNASRSGESYQSFQVQYTDIRFELPAYVYVNSRSATSFNSCDIVGSGYNQFSGTGTTFVGCTIRPDTGGMGIDVRQPTIMSSMTGCAVVGPGASPLFSFCDISIVGSAFVGCQLYQDTYGAAQIFSTGFFDCTASDGSIVAGDGGTVHLAGSVYGTGNTNGVRAAGGWVRTSAGTLPSVTATNYDVQVDSSSQVLPSLEASAGGSLPALVNMTTWAHYSSNNRKEFGFGTGSSITGKQD